VELADELADGAKGAALPLIRHDLGLSYGQVGLLASVPILAGGLLELPLGLLAGDGRARRRAVLGGGIVFVLTLVAVAFARALPELMIAFVAFYPASGAFVSLTQAELMDAAPDRRAQHMARWDLAGSSGAVAGPLMLAAVLASGGGWRDGYLVLGGCGAAAWLGVCRRRPAPPAGPAGAAAAGGAGGASKTGGASDAGTGEADRAGAASGASAAGGPESWTARAGEIILALRRGDVLCWLVLLQVADLLVDVLTGFLALYLVDVAHATPSQAALAVAVRLGAGLAGDAVLVLVLERASDLTVLRASAAAAALLYPGFLLVPGLVPRLLILAAVSAATAPWYPVLQARLYASLPGRSGVAVSLTSAAGLAGGLGPLAVGMAAQAFGLSWALTGLAIVPVLVLAGSVGQQCRTAKL
jgi:MFS transporter, FSR family, fosmidomycin resistance protein